MKRLIVLTFVIATLTGCAQNHFNVPAENFVGAVKFIGVAPILLDANSDINHPEKDLLLSSVAEINRKYDSLLIRKLQGTGVFSAVTPLTEEPNQLFTSLFSRKEKRDDAGVQYNKYFWKSEDLSAYMKKNHLDAVMFVVVSGITKSNRIFSSNLLTSLETDYNFLTMTGQIIGADGTLLWEYPNFRGHLLPYYPVINLQYPDFSESEANLTDTTKLRFKSVTGIRRTLEKKKSDWLLHDTAEPEIYGRLFEEMGGLIKDSISRKTREKMRKAAAPAAGVPVVPLESPAAEKTAVEPTQEPIKNEIPPSASVPTQVAPKVETVPVVESAQVAPKGETPPVVVEPAQVVPKATTRSSLQPVVPEPATSLPPASETIQH